MAYSLEGGLPHDLMLINLRGTHGSGKSTVVKRLFEQFKMKPIYGLLGPRKCEAYEFRVPKVEKPVYILGSYHTASGGCDQIQPYDLILELLEKYAARGHVIFEGALVSSSYGRVGRLMERWGQQAVMAFMSTSLEDCIKNVQTRRGVRLYHRELDPKNTISKFNQVSKSKLTIKKMGKLRVFDLDPNRGVKQILALLRSAE